MVPLQDEFGWSRGHHLGAVGVNLVLFGLTAPFAAALMDRFGIRRVVAVALLLVAAGSRADRLVMTSALAAGAAAGACWSGSAPARWRWCSPRPSRSRWFVRHRGLVTGILTAGSATGQLIFLPVARARSPSSPAGAGPPVAGHRRSRCASCRWCCWCCATAPPTAAPRRTAPERRARSTAAGRPDPEPRPGVALRRAARGVADAARSGCCSPAFAICGCVHQRADRHALHPGRARPRHAETTAAGLLALVGDLRHRRHDRLRLADRPVGPAAACSSSTTSLRGLSLLVVPRLLGPHVHPSLFVLHRVLRPRLGGDRAADRGAVPPALRRERAGVVFGWVFASHMVGAGVAACYAGWIRTAGRLPRRLDDRRRAVPASPRRCACSIPRRPRPVESAHDLGEPAHRSSGWVRPRRCRSSASRARRAVSRSRRVATTAARNASGGVPAAVVARRTPHLRGEPAADRGPGRRVESGRAGPGTGGRRARARSGSGACRRRAPTPRAAGGIGAGGAQPQPRPVADDVRAGGVVAEPLAARAQQRGEERRRAAEQRRSRRPPTRARTNACWKVIGPASSRTARRPSAHLPERLAPGEGLDVVG